MNYIEQGLLGLINSLRGQINALRAEITSSGITSSVKLSASNNLSDLTNVVAARTNLGLGTLATQSGTISGTNTGDETASTIKTKLGITTLSGGNTGDQDLSGYLLSSTASSTYFPLTGSTLGVTSGGNGLNSATLGDLRYGSGTNTLAALAGNTTTTQKFLTQTGNGTVSAAPTWIDLFGTANTWTAQQSLSSASSLVIYNTSDQTTNYERIRHYWVGNTYSMVLETGGTGSIRNMQLGSGKFLNLYAANSATVGYINSNFTTAGTGAMWSLSTTQTAASGIVTQFLINPTYNQSASSAVNTDLLINRTETSVGSGAQKLIDAQVGSTTKFNVDNGGNVYVGQNLATVARFTIGANGSNIQSIMQIATSSFSIAQTYSASGFGIRQDACTYTSTTSSGTISLTGVNTLATPTLAANSATTLTAAATLYINNAPLAGTNVTITNAYALYVAGGNSYFGGQVVLPVANSRLAIGTATAGAVLQLSTDYTTSGTFGVGGMGILQSQQTYTSTTSSGTVATGVINGFATPIMAANSATTLTTAATFYIGGAPTAGTNMTITNGYALYVAAGNVFIANNLQTNRITMGLSAFSTSAIAGTSGSLLAISATTITDSTTANSGTVTHGAVNAIAQSTIAATNTAITYTNASTLYINNAPTAGTNVTITNAYGLYIAGGNLGVATGIMSALRISTNGASFNTGGIAGVGGAIMNINGATITDTITATSGTVATGAVNGIGIASIAATNTGVTYSNAATLYIAGAPTAGTNVTVSLPWALYIASGQSLFLGGLQTNASGNTANLWVSGANNVGIGNQSAASMLFAGAANISTRVSFNGGNSSTLAVNNGYSNILIGSSPITAAASGTHALLANAVINPLGTVTNGSAIAITETATLYINGAGSGGTTNNALHVAGSSAQSVIDGKLIVNNTITAATGTTTIAPINIPSGTAKTTPVSGDIENNGTALQYTNGSAVRNSIALVKNTAELSYTAGTTGTITWDGTPPSGTETHKYRWQQVGNQVTVSGVLKYTTAGTTNTVVTLDLPTDCPTPVGFTGFTAASEIDFVGAGALGTSTTTSNSSSSAVGYMQLNAGATLWQIVIKSASISAKVARFSITYNAATL